jgi:hypothetical protein
MPGSNTEVNLEALNTRNPDLNAGKAGIVSENTEILNTSFFFGVPPAVGWASCSCVDC